MIGVPGTASKEVSLSPHDKPGVQKVACKQGSELLRTCLEAVSHECQVQSWTLQGAVKKALINHSDTPQLTLLPSAPGTAISQPVQGFPVSHLDSFPSSTPSQDSPSFQDSGFITLKNWVLETRCHIPFLFRF